MYIYGASCKSEQFLNARYMNKTHPARLTVVRLPPPPPHLYRFNPYKRTQDKHLHWHMYTYTINSIYFIGQYTARWHPYIHLHTYCNAAAAIFYRSKPVEGVMDFAERGTLSVSVPVEFGTTQARQILIHDILVEN